MRRPFADTLRDIRAGQVIEELDEALQQLVQQIQRTGKPGQMTLVIQLKPMKGSTEALIAKAAVNVKEPTFDDTGTVLFPTPEGNLQRSLWKQSELPGLSAVDQQPPKQVNE